MVLGIAGARLVEGFRERGRGARVDMGARSVDGAARCYARPGVEVRIAKVRSIECD